MTFVKEFQDFLNGNQTIKTHAQQLEIAGENVRDLSIRLFWKGLGETTVKPASPSDLAALTEFLTLGLGENSRFLFAPYPYDERLSNALEAVLGDCGEGKLLMYHAWHGERIVGHFFLGGFDKPIPELGIAVADDFHGRRLGHLFMVILMAAARVCGKEAIELTTNPSNKAGFHLYQKLGFEHVRDKEITLGDGTHRIEHVMIYKVSSHS